MGIWVLLVLAAANGLFLYVLPALADTDYAWSIKPPVNAAFIDAGFLPARSPPGSSSSTARAGARPESAAGAVGAREDAARGHGHPQGSFQVRLPAHVGLGPRLRRRPVRRPGARRRQRRVAEPTGRRSGLRIVRVLSAIVGLALVAGAAALFVAPAQLGEALGMAADAAAGPDRRRVVRAVRDDAAEVVPSRSAVPAEATVAYATLAAWSLLLLALPLLYLQST